MTNEKHKKYVVQNLNFAAPYPGNLMRSIWHLEDACKKKNIFIVYCFPNCAKHLSWVEDMIRQGHLVHFKPTKVNSTFWRNIIGQYNPIAVHTHFWNLRDSLSIRIATIFFKKTYLILHHHNTYFQSKSFFKELLKRIIIKSDLHITCGVFLCEYLKKMSFKNVIAIENAIDFTRLDVYESINRSDFDIEDDAKVCLIFGHDVYRKGVDIAIKALAELVIEKNVVLCVVLSREQCKAKEKLIDEFAEVPRWVKFLDPRDDVATYYRFVDAFLSPSREEGFCYALPEAAYSGCKVVFSDIDGQMHAAAIPGCVCFKSEDIEDLRNKIINIFDNDLPISAKEYVCDRYNLSTWCEKIAHIYRNL